MMQQNDGITVLGIDPGTRKTGWSVLRVTQGSVQLIAIDTVRLPATAPLATRVGMVGDCIATIIQEHTVSLIALETAFVAKNPQTFVKLGYIRGIIYYLAHQQQLQLQELAPMQVKQAITGWGAAPKEQVARVLHQLFPSLPPQATEDATDALAVALAGLWQYVHRQQVAAAESRLS